MNEFEFDLRENRTNPDLNVVNHSASLSLFMIMEVSNESLSDPSPVT